MAQKSDAKAYYGYLYEADKTPKELLVDLLKGIAHYIIECIGDKTDRVLSPAKLAAFYKAVGGNYDTLFVDTPHQSVSYIYQTIGCQHILQHTTNDYEAPSIPALTPRGFARWVAIEVLLNPLEHVQYLQAAVRNFDIKHPVTGESFPELPTEAFPLSADPAMEKWHKECSEKLHRVTPEENDHLHTRPGLPPRHSARTGYSYMRNPFSSGRPTKERHPGADYFSSRPLRYKHVPAGEATRPTARQGTKYQTYLDPNDVSPSSPRLRRRSFPENVYSPPLSKGPSPASTHPATPRPRPEDRTRRHSHPRHRRDSSSSSSTSSSDTESDSKTPPSSPTSAASRKPQPDIKRPPSTIHVTVPTPPLSASYPNSPQRRHNCAAPRERPSPYKIPPDLSGKHSTPLMPGVRHMPPPQRGGSVRYSSTNEVPQYSRRASLNTSATTEDPLEGLEDDPRRARDRDRRRRGDGRPRLVQARSGSHDGRYTTRDSERRDRDRERYSDRDEKEMERRRDRNRVSNPSLPKADWRKYLPEILR